MNRPTRLTETEVVTFPTLIQRLNLSLRTHGKPALDRAAVRQLRHDLDAGPWFVYFALSPTYPGGLDLEFAAAHERA